MVGGCSLFDGDSIATCPVGGPTLPVLDPLVVDAPIKPLVEDDGFASYRVALDNGDWVNIAIAPHANGHHEAAGDHSHDHDTPGTVEVTRGETIIDVLVEETELPEGDLVSYIWSEGDITVFAAALNSPVDAPTLITAISLTSDQEGWLASETTSELSELEPCVLPE